jgi:hypothetical protein
MNGEKEVEEVLEKLEASVVEEIFQYCADCGTPPSAEVLAETIETRRDQSGPGLIQELYLEVAERVRRRLRL